MKFFSAKAAAEAQDAPVSDAELKLLRDSVALLEECDMQQGGKPSETTRTVRAAYERAKNGRRP